MQAHSRPMQTPPAANQKPLQSIQPKSGFSNHETYNRHEEQKAFRQRTGHRWDENPYVGIFPFVCLVSFAVQAAVIRATSPLPIDFAHSLRVEINIPLDTFR